jgi:hypothetical protein
MHFSTFSPEEKRKHDVEHAKREIQEWRRFYATTKEPWYKLFAESQIKHHQKTISENPYNP